MLYLSYKLVAIQGSPSSLFHIPVRISNMFVLLYIHNAGLQPLLSDEIAYYMEIRNHTTNKQVTAIVNEADIWRRIRITDMDQRRSHLLICGHRQQKSKIHDNCRAEVNEVDLDSRQYWAPQL